MRRALSLALALVIVLSGPTSLAAQQNAAPSTRDKAFWQAVAAKEFAVPAGVPLPTLLDELTQLLGHVDPELRDDLGYSTLANWIYRQRVVPVDERLRLLGVLEKNLSAGIGETNTDAVLRRSFSALALGVLAILDNEAAYLDRAQFARLLTSSLKYLREERDVRGFDARVGWMHSAAHTADLIKFLARSRHLQPAEQTLILSAISDKWTAVTTPLVNGEDERMARAVLSLIARPDFDEAAFVAWTKVMVPPRRTTPPTVGALATDQNRRDLLVSLFTVLSTDRRDLPTLVKARAILLETLRTFM
jgi:Protein of unknown function (DUF2785)